MGTSKEGKQFEKKVSDLEEIVGQLESGEASLEDSLALVEKGTKLLKELSGILEEAEQKVQVLTKDSAGTVVEESYIKPDDVAEGEDDL